MLRYVKMFCEKSTSPRTGILLRSGMSMFFRLLIPPSGSLRLPVGEADIICSPMKFESPVPNIVSVRPVTFWFAIIVMVRKA